MQVPDEIVAFTSLLRDKDFRPNVLRQSVDGLTYVSQKLPTTVGLDLWPKTTALLGAFARGLVVGEDDLDWGSAMSRLADRAMVDGLSPFVKDLLQCTQCNKVKTLGEGHVLDAFDEHFAGEYVHLAKVCIFVLKHNFQGPTLGTRSKSGVPEAKQEDSEDVSEASTSPTSTP